MKSVVPLLLALTLFYSVPAIAGERLVVGLVGTDTGETGKIPRTDRDTKKANCFDVSLVSGPVRHRCL